MNELQIIKCGTEVLTKLSKIVATITGVSIRFDTISYEISYFNNGEHKTAWIYEHEFTIDNVEKIKVGFK